MDVCSPPLEFQLAGKTPQGTSVLFSLFFFDGTDGRVRTVQLALAETTRDSKGRRVSEERFLERPIHKLVLLMSREEQDGC